MIGHHTQSTTYARAPRPTLMQRLRGRRTARTGVTGRRVTKAPLVTNRAGHPTSSTYATAHTHDSHSKHAAPRHTTRAGHAGPTARRTGFWKKKTVVRQQRKPTMGDKLSGAMLKLKGSLTGRPGQKGARTRRY